MRISKYPLAVLLAAALPGMGNAAKPTRSWESPPVCQMNGRNSAIALPAQSWLVSEAWMRPASEPYMVYIPEKHRLIMLLSLDWPHRPALMHSDDYGATWSDPVYFGRQFTRRDDGGQEWTDGLGLTYLGEGKLAWVGQFDFVGTFRRWFSGDYGETWDDHPLALEAVPEVAAARSRHIDGPVNMWDPMLVEKDPNTGVTTAYETGYYNTGDTPSGGYAWAYLRTSTDYGHTWSDPIQPPQWAGVNEIALCRAKNGDLVAACRTVCPDKFKMELDNWQGLGVSTSRDNGQTWSPVRKLYDWGRHHPCMVVLPDGTIVMTHIVRRGYSNDPDNFPRFGIEAVVSHDNGRTWDLDHKYILACWVGNAKREVEDVRVDSLYDWSCGMWAAPQNTSSILLPDGSILTAFGTGFRSQRVRSGLGRFGYSPVPFDIGLVRWRVSGEGLNSDATISNAAFDSDLRNVFDPTSAWHAGAGIQHGSN